MKKMLVLLSSMAALAGATYGDRYTGDHPYGNEYGLVDAICGNGSPWPFRQYVNGMVTGGSGFELRSGVTITYLDNGYTFTNEGYGDEGDKREYSTSPLWAPAAVYQVEVWGDSTTVLSGFTPNATYKAEIHCAETYNDGQNRIFRCKANGVTLVCGLRPCLALNPSAKGAALNFSADVQADAEGKITFVINKYSDNGIFGGYAVWGTSAPTWTNPTIVGNGTDVEMSWSSPYDVHRYYVYSADSAEGPWTEKAVLLPGATSHTIPSAYNPTVEKYWRVVASNGVGTVTCQAKLGDASSVTWTDLATLGETVVSDATANYRVATAGTGATNALGAATTEAAMYVNGYTDAHTLAIGSDETLKVGTLGVLSNAGDMTVGDTVGQGAVSPLSGTLTFDVKDAASTLTVNAVATKVANTDSIVKFGDGAAKLAGGTDFTTISIGAGSVELPNADDATLAQTLSGAGTFVKSGAGTLTVANENPNFAGTFEVKEGTLLIGRTDAYKSFGEGAATIKVDSGATLDVGMPGGGQNAVKLGATKIVFEGTGDNGAGALANSSGTSQYESLTCGEMSGDAMVKATSRFDFRNGSYFNMNGHVLTKTGGSDFLFTSIPVYAGGDTAKIVVQAGTFGVESSTTFNGNGTIELAGGAFDLYNLGTAMQWPVAVKPAGGKFVSRSGNTTQNNVAGTVTLDSGATLTLDVADNHNLRITGKITGAGKLVRDGGGDAGYARIENTGNDWTGGTEVRKGILYCPCAAVLPGYNQPGQIVISGTGKIAVKLGSGGDDGWSAEQINALMVNANAPEGAKGLIMIDTAGNDAASGTGTVSKPIGIGKTGDGTFTAEMEYTAGGGIYADQGTLVISNNAENTMSGLQVIKKGRVEIYDSEIDFGNNNLNIGNVRSDGDIPTVVVGKGAYIHSYMAPYNSGSPSLFLGSADVGGGILEVQDGGVVSNKLFMGNNQFGQSAILQSGGEIVNWGGAASDTVFANAQWTWGYWEVAGTGSATFMGYSQLTRNSTSYATLAIRDDSSVILTNALGGSLTMSRGGHGAFDQSGGTLTTAGQLIFGDDSNNSGGYGVYEMRGGTANIGGEKAESVLVSDRPTFKGQINFNDGVFAAKNLWRNTRDAPNTAYATFNGGTFKAKQGGTQLFGEASGNKLDGVYVFEKGAQFDTDGHNVSPGQTLRAPTGLGVKAIRWTQTDAAKLKWKGTELMGPPMVIIEGDGEGATAVVDFDTATRRVKGIIVTSPGWGYTEKPTVKLFGGGLVVDNNTQTYTIDASAVTMGASSAGQIVKKGAGTLTLEGENGVVGAEVQGGVLSVPAGASIQPGRLTLAGGQFSAPSYTATELIVNGEAGDVSTLDTVLSISGERVSLRQPGLYAAFKNGALDTTFTATADDNLLVVTNLEYAQTSIPGDYKIFEDLDYVNSNLNCAYDGYIWNRTGEAVTWTFAEHFDDFVYLKIDDEVVLNDCEQNAWTRPTFGSVTLTPGPHRFHLVVYQGGGTSGPCVTVDWFQWWQYPDGGWAIGVDFQGRDAGVYENFVALEDPGDGSLFTLTTDDLDVQDFAPDAYVHVNGGTLKIAPSSAGLFGGFVDNGTYKTADCPRTGVYPNLDYANVKHGDADVLDEHTNANIDYVFEGYIWNHGDEDATWTFAENFDDNVYLTVDGAKVLDNGNWNAPSKANVTLTPGAHAIRIGLHQGTGGSGPSGQGWLTGDTIGIGIDFEGRDEEAAANYVPLTATAHGGELPLLTTAPYLPNVQPLPANTSFAIANGAKVDLGGADITLSGDFYSAAGAFTNGTLTVAGDWTVDFADIVAGNALTGTSFDFTGATLVLTGDAELLDKSVTYILATATGSITGVPTVDNAPKGWSVSIRGSNLLFSCRHGMKVSIR